MSLDRVPVTWQAQNEFVRDSWHRNAAFWDQHMGEGNDFQNELLAPALEELLAVQPGQRVLEIACGNGNFARRLADLGAHVVACDFAPGMIEAAKARSASHAGRIEYSIVDATDPAQLRGLAPAPFDALVCNMALMDIAAIEPLIDAGKALLGPGAPFVFSVMHPCFNNVYTTLIAENAYESDGRERVTYSVRVLGYSESNVALGQALLDQPAPQLYFHRPLEELFSAFFRAGYVLDGLREPAFAGDGTPNKRPNWEQMKGIPPVLVARMRTPAS